MRGFSSLNLWIFVWSSLLYLFESEQVIMKFIFTVIVCVAVQMMIENKKERIFIDVILSFESVYIMTESIKIYKLNRSQYKKSIDSLSFFYVWLVYEITSFTYVVCHSSQNLRSVKSVSNYTDFQRKSYKSIVFSK